MMSGIQPVHSTKLAALGDPARLRIVARLSEAGPLSVVHDGFHLVSVAKSASGFGLAR